MKRLLTGERGMAAIFVVLIVLGVIVVGVVAAGAVILSNSVTITVKNQSCGTLDIAKGSAAMSFNFLPGINVPSEISQGETTIVQIPKMFVNSVSVNSGKVGVNAFGRSFSFGTSRIDMQRSTLDGTPLNGFIGHLIDLSKEHTLVLVCQ
jgi:hypothetical protein